MALLFWGVKYQCAQAACPVCRKSWRRERLLSDSDQKMLIRLKGPPGFWPLMEILLGYVWPCSPWALFCVLSDSQGTSAVRGPAGPGEITAQSPAQNCPGIRISKPALPCLSLSSRVQRHGPSWTGIPAKLASNSYSFPCLIVSLAKAPPSAQQRRRARQMLGQPGFPQKLWKLGAPRGLQGTG